MEGMNRSFEVELKNQGFKIALENQGSEMKRCALCGGPLALVVSGVSTVQCCLRCQHNPLVGQGSMFEGLGIPIPPRPTVEESQKRTKETLNLIQKEEKSQGLSWPEICQKEASEQAKEEQRQELAHQEFLEAQIKTRRTIAEHERLKRGEESQAKLEGYVKAFEQLDRVAAVQEAERLAELERHRRTCEGK